MKFSFGSPELWSLGLLGCFRFLLTLLEGAGDLVSRLPEEL